MNSQLVIDTWELVEQTGLDWPTNVISTDLSAEATARALALAGQNPALVVVDENGHVSPAQIVSVEAGAQVWHMASLGPYQRHQFKLVCQEEPLKPIAHLEFEEGMVEWKTAQFGVRLAWAAGKTEFDQPIRLDQLGGPILSVRGPDGIWLGAGRWRSPAQCRRWECAVVESGPVVWVLRQSYTLEDNSVVTIEHQLNIATPALQVTVRSNGAAEAQIVWDACQGEPFEPDRAFWRPHSPATWRGAKTAHNRQIYSLRWDNSPDTITLRAFYDFVNVDSAMFWACWGDRIDRRDMLLTAPIRPSRTRCAEPCLPVSIRTWQDGSERHLEVSVPVQRGQKCFCIAVIDRHNALPEQDDAGSPVEALYRQLQCLNLDDYKRMCLDWTGMAEIRFPHVLIAPEEIASTRKSFQEWDWLRQRFKAHVEDRLFLTNEQPDMRIRPGARTLGSDWAGAYLVTGDDKYAARAKSMITARLNDWVRWLAALGPTEDFLIGMGMAQPLRATCIAFDLVAGSPAFTDAERTDCLRKLAFITEVISTEDAWPTTESGLHRGNPNFHADFVAAKGIAAALLNGHPRQAQWLDTATQQAVEYLEEEFLDSGCAKEAATYQFVSLSYLLLLSCALQHLGRDSLLERTPSMKRGFDYLAAIQTPPDPRTGFCMTPTVGHVTSYGWCQSLQAYFAWAARATRTSDPAFSERMMAAWRRAGSIPISLHMFFNDSIWWPPLCMLDRTLPAGADPQRASGRLHHGLGAVLRAAHPSGEEGYLLIKMGPARGHFEPDEGSLLWYAYGRPLLADFGCQYNPNIEFAQLHNRLSFDGWNEVYAHHFEIRKASFGRHIDHLVGEMTVSTLFSWGDWPIRETDFDFRLIEQRRSIAPLRWRRSALYIRPCEAVLVRDVVIGSQATDWNLQVFATEARVNGNSVDFRGQFGVDLQAHFAQPGSPDLAISSFEHQGFNESRLPAYWWKAARWTEPDNVCFGPLGERALTLRARLPPSERNSSRQEYVALLVARRASRSPYTITASSEGREFKWSDERGRWQARLVKGLDDSAAEEWFVSHESEQTRWEENG